MDGRLAAAHRLGLVAYRGCRAGTAGTAWPAMNNHAAFIWSVADLLRGDDQQSEYGRVIMPLTAAPGSYEAPPRPPGTAAAAEWRLGTET